MSFQSGFFDGMDQYYMGWHIYGVGGKGGGLGCMVAKAKQRSKMTQMMEFRVAMTSTCTYNELIFHYKA